MCPTGWTGVGGWLDCLFIPLSLWKSNRLGLICKLPVLDRCRFSDPAANVVLYSTLNSGLLGKWKEIWQGKRVVPMIVSLFTPLTTDLGTIALEFQDSALPKRVGWGACTFYRTLWSKRRTISIASGLAHIDTSLHTHYLLLPKRNLPTTVFRTLLCHVLSIWASI